MIQAKMYLLLASLYLTGYANWRSREMKRANRLLSKSENYEIDSEDFSLLRVFENIDRLRNNKKKLSLPDTAWNCKQCKGLALHDFEIHRAQTHFRWWFPFWWHPRQRKVKAYIFLLGKTIMGISAVHTGEKKEGKTEIRMLRFRRICPSFLYFIKLMILA